MTNQAVAVFLVTYFGLHVVLALDPKLRDDENYTTKGVLFKGLIGIKGIVAVAFTLAFVLWNS